MELFEHFVREKFPLNEVVNTVITRKPLDKHLVYLSFWVA